MSELFLTVLNMSIAASWIVLCVFLLRIIFKKAPKWINILLWGIVAVRLVCPFSFESVLSLIPSAQTVNPSVLISEAPEINTGFETVDNIINPVISETVTAIEPEKSVNTFKLSVLFFSKIWLVGVGLMLLYALVSYIKIKNSVREATREKQNIFICEKNKTPFILGIIKPKIYLPSDLTQQDAELVISHEKAHIKRKDYIWKPLGFLLLSLHWFNPLIWIGYAMLCRDIELACDEKAVKDLDKDKRADYSQALLTCSVSRRVIGACPLAFGEVSVKERVKTVLNYKKPAFWVIILSVVAVIAAFVCFLTNPKTEINGGHSVEPLSDGLIQFYAAPTDEHETPVIESSAKMSQDDLDSFLERIKAQKWVDDAITDRINFNFDCRISYGDFIYIGFEQKVIYCKGYFTELSDSDAYIIKSYQLGDFLSSGKAYLYESPHDKAELILSADSDKCSFICSLYSGNWEFGTYEKSKGYLTLKTDDGEKIYTFKIRNINEYIFVADKSSDVPQFFYSENATEKEPCVPDGAVFKSSAVFYSDTLDRISYDIDNDGKNEDCFLSYGPTSGVFTFVISASENGKDEYYNVFSSPAYDFSFEEKNGKLMLNGVTQGDNPKTHYFKIEIKNKNIYINDNEFYYWGEQGINAYKNNSANNNQGQFSQLIFNGIDTNTNNLAIDFSIDTNVAFINQVWNTLSIDSWKTRNAGSNAMVRITLKFKSDNEYYHIEIDPNDVGYRKEYIPDYKLTEEQLTQPNPITMYYYDLPEGTYEKISKLLCQYTDKSTSNAITPQQLQGIFKGYDRYTFTSGEIYFQATAEITGDFMSKWDLDKWTAFNPEDGSHENTITVYVTDSPDGCISIFPNELFVSITYNNMSANYKITPGILKTIQQQFEEFQKVSEPI